MGLQQKLLDMLGDSFQIERVSADDFLVKPDGFNSVRLHASEADLADYSALHAADGLLALGDVGGDGSGVTAALGLLSVHIAEEITASGDQRIVGLTVRGGGLDIRRVSSADR